MRSLLSLICVALLAIGLGACAQSRKPDRRLSYMDTPQAKLGGATPMQAAVIRHKLIEKIEWVHLTPQPHLANDGDHEEAGDEDHDNSHDTGTSSNPGSVDPYEDYLPTPNKKDYHDEDDQFIIEGGAIAGPAETRTIDAMVEHYYAAGKSGDGARACSLMTRRLARVTPIEYGRFGASYLRSARTCADVVSRVFGHVHAELTEPLDITQVRINYNRVDAKAFFGTHKIPASEISLRLEHGSWRINQIIGSPMP